MKTLLRPLLPEEASTAAADAEAEAPAVEVSDAPPTDGAPASRPTPPASPKREDINTVLLLTVAVLQKDNQRMKNNHKLCLDKVMECSSTSPLPLPH